MSVHKYNSWGRTRSQKTLLAPGNRSYIRSKYKQPAIYGTNWIPKIKDTQTENQRYLHVLVTDAHASAPAAVTIYMHAFQRWFGILARIEPVGANTQAVSVADSEDSATAQVGKSEYIKS